MKGKIHKIEISDLELNLLVRELFSEEEIKKNKFLLIKTVDSYTNNLKKFLMDKLSHELCSLNISRVEE